MTAHAIRAIAEKPDGVTEKDARELVEGAISGLSRNLSEQEVRIQTVDNALTDAPEYFSGIYRFPFDNDKTEIIDFIEQELRNRPDINWFELKYHECYHDEPNGGTCNEEIVVSVGSIPDSI